MNKLNKKENIIILYLLLMIIYFVTSIKSLSLYFFLSYNFIFALYFLILKLKQNKKIEKILNIILLIFIAYSLTNSFIGLFTLFSNAEGFNLITELYKTIVTILLGLYLLIKNPLLKEKIKINFPYNIMNILEIIVLILLIITSFDINHIFVTVLSIIKNILYISLKLLIIRYYHVK